MKIEDRLDHSNNEMLEFRSERKLTTLDFRRAGFGCLRDLLGKVPCDKVLEGRESSRNQESCLIFFQVHEWSIPVNRNLGKNE